MPARTSALFTIPLALAVGDGGRVLAFEPAPRDRRAAADNVRRDRLENVTVFDAALGAARGSTTLLLADDAAYNSTAGSAPVTGASAEVRMEQLDDLWAELGRPEISVLKVDVEGAEVDVLAGAAELLRASRPAVLVEAAEPHRVEAVRQLFAEHGYRLTSRSRPAVVEVCSFLPSERPASLPHAVHT